MYNNDDLKQTVNIPVKIDKGRIEYLYGNELPEIRNGAEGNLIIPQHEILDKEFVFKIQNEKKIELFPFGERLLIAVNTNFMQQDMWKYPISVENVYPKVPFKFIEIVLQSPLYLVVRGTKKPILYGGECSIPILKTSAKSINSAYTKISETYETKRISHTANVFNKCFYFNKENKHWIELDKLREKIQSQYESELYINKDDDKIDDKFIIELNLDETEIRIIKLLEIFGQISSSKIKEIIGTQDDSLEIIKLLINKGVIKKVR